MRRAGWSLLALALLTPSARAEKATASPESTGTEPLAPQATAFRIRMGQRDERPTPWDGSLSVENGRLRKLLFWDRRPGDKFTGANSWKSSSRRKRATSRKARQIKPENRPMNPTAVVAVLDGGPQTRLKVTTAQGNFEVAATDFQSRAQKSFLNQQVQVKRITPSTQVAASPAHEDFPAVAIGGDGVLWLAYTAFTEADGVLRQIKSPPKNFDFLALEPGGDQIWLRSLKDGRWSDPLPVTGNGLDIYRCAAAVDGQGRVWVFWSQNTRGNFDIWGRFYRNGKFSSPQRLTTDPGSDFNIVATTDSGGRVCIAWQGFRGDNSDILFRSAADGRWTAEQVVSHTPANEWAPAIAADGRGRVGVAWDTYAKGDYDVYVRQRRPDGTWAPKVGVATTLRFEARPSIDYDSQGRLWIAYESAAEMWGKDNGALDKNAQRKLYFDRDGNVVCLDGDRLLAPPAFQSNLPRWLKHRKASFLTLRVDSQDRVWVTDRTEQDGIGRSGGGTVVSAWACYLTAQGWSEPQYLLRSDCLLSRPVALARHGNGLLAVFASDDRQFHLHGGGRNYDLHAALLTAGQEPSAPSLTPVEMTAAAPPPSTEADDVRRLRTHRALIDGKVLRIVRGEFHRHTEISGDGGNDGALMDMWRYAIDAASMDWLGNGDHDNGGGFEYTWWLIQKTTDIFHVGEAFVPMFTYERSVRYPDGHRNAMFARRGIRPLSRLRGEQVQQNGVSRGDAKMFYRSLHQFGGICAEHTSATNMGTDWRDNDPEVEPIVEIYQGDRQSYEGLGQPKTATGNRDSIGGWQPAGMVWNALAKGYRLGFQSSSDHISTHISYGMVFVEQPTRQAIVEAFKRRHCYAATDNILMEVRMGDHMMGDEFTSSAAPRLDIYLVGTDDIAELAVVRDGAVVHTMKPDRKSLKLTWQDNAPKPGQTSYYYVRALQKNNEIAWGSPMWIRYQP